MAEVKKTVGADPRQSGKAILQSEIKQGYAREIALYEDFFRKVSDHAKTHRQISINNLNEAEKRLRNLKGDAEKIADSIFYHEEEIIVDRSRIISDTETLVHGTNEDILHHDRLRFPETLSSLDYLSKAILQIKYDFLAFYSRTYLNNILSSEEYFDYFLEKSQAFQQILERHQNEIYDLFVQLDTQIKSMDDNISNIIRQKNRKVNDIETFFEKEASYYADNQLSFSAESDPTSVEIQALVSDKINQFNAFCAHTNALNLKIQKTIEDDYAALYRKVLNRLLQSRSYQIINKFDLFDDPVKYKSQYKRDLLNAEATRSHDEGRLLQTYQKISRWQRDVRQAEVRATKMLKHQARRQKAILRLSEEQSLRTMNRLELYLNEYIEVMKSDPFLAQTIGDESSKIIKDELTRISLLRLNKELKTNIDYDIQSAKIKSQINELELIMMNAIKKQLVVQEGELLTELQKIHLFLLEKRRQFAKSSFAVLRERHQVERLEKATEEHLGHLSQSGATSRRWLSTISEDLIRYSREKETHNIYVVEAKAELELALKEYRIKALHFETMFENEKSYLMMQKSRVGEGVRVNNEFILTTYLNQMRFAQEQITLADSEHRVRLESLVTTIDQERQFYEDQIRQIVSRYDSDIKLIEDDYQAKVYAEARRLKETSDRREQKSLSLSLDRERRMRDQRINLIVRRQDDDQIIAKSRRELTLLDGRLKNAVSDADRLREVTIAEFQELYDRAKARYETLKPYMENAVDILDPTFYDTLASINSRHEERLREAETELDAKAEALLPKYREIFFAQDEKDHSAEYAARIAEVMSARDQDRLLYEQRLQAVEAEYQRRLAALSREESMMESETEVEMTAVQTRISAMESQFRLQTVQAEKDGEARIKAHRDATAKTIQRLTEEYVKSLKSSQGTIEELSQDFRKVLDGYGEYKRFAERDSGYRRIVRSIRRAERKRLRVSLKQLDAKFRKYRIDAKKA